VGDIELYVCVPGLAEIVLWRLMWVKSKTNKTRHKLSLQAALPKYGRPGPLTAKLPVTSWR
jgi:hypothetical protein